MQYHVIFSLPEAAILAGPGPIPEHTFDSFEEAKSVAIADLEHWIGQIQGNLDALKKSRSLAELNGDDSSSQS